MLRTELSEWLILMPRADEFPGLGDSEDARGEEIFADPPDVVDALPVGAVRGLGDRYSSTSLNGSKIPSTEFEKKVVPLDLFPADLIEKITVSKSYTVDKPGDFAAGLVELSTVEFPSAQQGSIGFSLGHNSATTGRGWLEYPGGWSTTAPRPRRRRRSRPGRGPPPSPAAAGGGCARRGRHPPATPPAPRECGTRPSGPGRPPPGWSRP